MSWKYEKRIWEDKKLLEMMKYNSLWWDKLIKISRIVLIGISWLMITEENDDESDKHI